MTNTAGSLPCILSDLGSHTLLTRYMMAGCIYVSVKILPFVSWYINRLIDHHLGHPEQSEERLYIDLQISNQDPDACVHIFEVGSRVSSSYEHTFWSNAGHRHWNMFLWSLYSTINFHLLHIIKYFVCIIKWDLFLAISWILAKKSIHQSNLQHGVRAMVFGDYMPTFSRALLQGGQLYYL